MSSPPRWKHHETFVFGSVFALEKLFFEVKQLRFLLFKRLSRLSRLGPNGLPANATSYAVIGDQDHGLR